MFEVLSYIHENITNQVSAAETAEHFGYSKWYFCKKFHEFSGMTFTEYVRRYRIQLAAIDILAGKKVTDVAFDYGYDTPGGFNKAFLKEYGCMPRVYKKQAKECQLYYERRKNSMYKLTDRCMMLRDEAVNGKRYTDKYCAERNVYFSIGLSEAMAKGLTPDECMAGGVVNVLEKFTPFIAPSELICGFNFGDAPDKGESNMPQNDEAGISLMRENGISEEDIGKFFSGICDLPLPKTIMGQGFTRECDVLTLTEVEKAAKAERSSLGRNTNANHTVIGYEKVLKYGFEGLYKQVCEYEAKNGSSPLYTSAKSICLAAMKMGEKYAAEAERLIAENDAAYRRQDLEFIAKTCRRVPRHPAGTFAEAVQSLWFAHIINTWEDLINANSLGRLDQILYPYYKSDVEKGVITREEAFELIGCLWVKLYRDYDVQQSCVGGTFPDGTSAVNELSYMMLDATEQLDFIRCLSVRFGKNTEKEFIKRALEVVGHVQKGVPFFFNDDVMIPALIEKGISREDAYNYTQLGCVETVIPGRSNPHAVAGETNLLKAIEFVLNNGCSMVGDRCATGIPTGELSMFDTYEKFHEAVMVQVDNIIDLACSIVKKLTDGIASPKPYKSLLTDGCLESGKDFNSGGAVYDYHQIMLGGIPNLADSLTVIKKFVYTDKKYTLHDIKSILEADYPDERVRLEFLNKAAKFGNDIDEVDDIAVQITEHACDMLDALSEKYGLSFHAQPFTFLWMLDYGRNSAASPDGRRAGEPIAYSVSPMQGRDFNGLTAVLNSISKLPTKRTAGTTSAIVEVDPKLFGDRNIDTLADILIAAGKKGLSNVQFNTVDADTLRDAKAHPEKYNNLAVRVSGFSQKFNLLNSDLQDHIIGRTKHSCL
ncbi:MAG: helix-turn-helix domain-containing protein [Clostridia bacterium]|nr:helix-turn-helix domain-containing protein [Clostridia bacterium]